VDLHLKLKTEISNLLTSNNLAALFLAGKMGIDTSIELMKIVNVLDRDPDSPDVFFSYHHQFQTMKDYVSEIMKDLREQYFTLRDQIDRGGSIQHIFSRNYIYVGFNNHQSTTAFIELLNALSTTLRGICRNIVFLLDPSPNSNPRIFNQNLHRIIETRPDNVKFIILEDSTSAKEGVENLRRRSDVRKFTIPSNAEDIIDYMEKELVQNKYLQERQKADLQHVLANIYRGQGKIDKAVTKYRAALILYVRNGLYREEYMVWVDLALMYYLEKDYNSTIQYYRKALEVSRKNHFFSMAIFSSVQIARLYSELGKRTEALEFYNQGLELCDKGREYVGKGGILSAMGELHLGSEGQMIQAKGYFTQALDLDRQQGNFFGQAKDLDRLSRIYKVAGNLADAKNCEALSRHIQKERGFSLEVDKESQSE